MKDRIGNYIIPIDDRNKEHHDYPVLGINREKDFMPTAANMEGIDTSKYKIVRKGVFVFSGMQTGRDICIRIALYDKEEPCLISPAYTTFILDEDKNIMPEFFFMFFNRKESDRYGAFISDSSVRANLDWDRFLDIQIPLPSIEEQQKVVNAWKALREIKEQNEAIAAPLMQVCQSYIQELKHKYESVEIGPYINRIDKRNSDNAVKVVKSVSVLKVFNDTNAKVDKNNLTSYKVVEPNQISFVQTTGNEKCLCAAINQYDYPVVVTSVNEVFETDPLKLSPNFLHLWFRRTELDRYARFHSWGSARETFTWDDMQRVRIPLPPIDVQQSIVNLYNCANEAKKIAEEADKKSREICPALIQYVINK